MFVVVDRDREMVNVLDTQTKTIEKISIEECEGYVSKGFNIIGFGTSFRRMSRTKYYKMYNDIPHWITVYGLNHKQSCVSNGISAEFNTRKYKNINVSGSLLDYDVDCSVYSSYDAYNTDNMSSCGKDCMSYLQRVIYQEILFYSLFSYICNFHRRSIEPSVGVDILWEYLKNNSNISLDKISYNDNMLLIYLRYVYGIINNIPELTILNPTFDMFGNSFFNVDLEELKNNCEIFELKDKIYFCDDKVCVWVSKKDLIDAGLDYVACTRYILKNKLAGNMCEGITINPANGMFIVIDCQTLVIEDGFKYSIVASSIIDKIVIKTDKPDIELRSIRLKQKESKPHIYCYNLVVPEGCDNWKDIVKYLGLDLSELRLEISCKFFGQLVDDLENYTSFKSIKLVNIDPAFMSNIIREKFNNFDLFRKFEEGFVENFHRNFCSSLNHYFDISVLDSDLVSIIRSIYRLRSLIGICTEFELDLPISDNSCFNVYTLCNNISKENNGVSFRTLFKRIFPELNGRYNYCPTDKWLEDNSYIKDVLTDNISELYYNTLSSVIDEENNLYQELDKKYNLKPWIVTSYYCQVPSENYGFDDNFVDKLFRTEIMRKQWGSDTKDVICTISRIIRIKLFKKGIISS